MTDPLPPHPTVLIADDNAAQRYAEKRVLTAAGYSVIEAASGMDALKMAGSADVMLLDLFLPDVDGFDVCKQLRASGATAALPILHVSGVYGGDAAAAESQRVGADGFLSKPVAPDRLLESVKVALHKGH